MAPEDAGFKTGRLVRQHSGAPLPVLADFCRLNVLSPSAVWTGRGADNSLLLTLSCAVTRNRLEAYLVPGCHVMWLVGSDSIAGPISTACVGCEGKPA